MTHLRAPRYGGQVRCLRTVVATAALVLTLGGARALACPACFGAEEAPLIDGAKRGVAVLLAITLVVQGGFVSFFLYLRKRAKRMAELELDAEGQRRSRVTALA